MNGPVEKVLTHQPISQNCGVLRVLISSILLVVSHEISFRIGALPGRRANTEHAYGLTRSVVKLMRSVGRDVQGFAGADGRLLAPERGFHLAFEEDEGLLEVMPVRGRTAARRDVHVDDAEASGSLLAGHGDGVSISNQSNVREVVGFSDGEAAFWIVRQFNVLP